MWAGSAARPPTIFEHGDRSRTSRRGGAAAQRFPRAPPSLDRALLLRPWRLDASFTTVRRRPSRHTGWMCAPLAAQAFYERHLIFETPGIQRSIVVAEPCSHQLRLAQRQQRAEPLPESLGVQLLPDLHNGFLELLHATDAVVVLAFLRHDLHALSRVDQDLEDVRILPHLQLPEAPGDHHLPRHPPALSGKLGEAVLAVLVVAAMAVPTTAPRRLVVFVVGAAVALRLIVVVVVVHVVIPVVVDDVVIVVVVVVVYVVVHVVVGGGGGGGMGVVVVGSVAHPRLHLDLPRRNRWRNRPGDLNAKARSSGDPAGHRRADSGSATGDFHNGHALRFLQHGQPQGVEAFALAEERPVRVDHFPHLRVLFEVVTGRQVNHFALHFG
mmetsp:Transcript_5227/g.10348  ORF Transcript_5227/g.10348 Transcript_5227/m.10348 type:complete len:383 (+) Transcript_5227:84-1232(+)